MTQNRTRTTRIRTFGGAPHALEGAWGPRLAAAFVFAAGFSATGWAQHTLDRPVGEFVEHRLDTGELANPGAQPSIVFSDVVERENAAWVRLYFSDVNLAPGSSVRFTSLLDGAMQELDAAGLEMWERTSAYFNGPGVLLELIAAPHSQGNRLVLERLALEFRGGGPDNHWCGICGTDLRYPSQEEWSGRLMPVGCTGSISMRNSCIVSAGHCMGSATVMQFRVPPSNPDCTVRHPGPEDQFPVTGSRFRNSGVGADWAVLTTGVNNLNETAYERYGTYRPVATTPAQLQEPVDVWGYAVDHDCARNQAQQHSPEGRIHRVLSTYYDIWIDVTFGNSGSGLIRDGEIVGIVTHCRQGCPNVANRMDISDFAAARLDLCGSDEFRLSEPVPGLAGQNNTLTVMGGEPGATVWFVYGFVPGSRNVPGCPGATVGIASPIIAGSAVADGFGTTEFTGFVPTYARGRTIYIQAVEAATCMVSNMLNFTFE